MARPKQEWIPYEQIKVWVHKLKLSNYKDWLQYVKEHKIPSGIPRNPQITYGDDYVSDADFLGHVNYMSYQDAKHFAQALKLQSYTEWLTWHKKHKPQAIPRYPDQVYNDWETWGEFLGTGNICALDKTYRKYNEAIKYVHSLQLKSYHEWLEWCQTGNRPDDIPPHPDRVYAKWTNWTDWLGSNVVSKMKAQNTNTSILYIIHEVGFPPNVFTIGVETKGKGALQDRQQIENFTIGKTFPYDPSKQTQIDEIINRYTTPYTSGASNQYLIVFIHQLVFDLRELLE